jgi:hypothetical protein
MMALEVQITSLSDAWMHSRYNGAASSDCIPAQIHSFNPMSGKLWLDEASILQSPVVPLHLMLHIVLVLFYK